MKKFLEKNDLIKWTGVIIIISLILTWVFKISVEETSSFYRIGVMDFFTLALLGLNLYTPLVAYVLVLAGFYVLLNKTYAYHVIVDKTAGLFKKTKYFSVFISLLIVSLLTAFLAEPLVVLLFIPFFVSVLIKLKFEKMTIFLATFGGMLVGTIGNLYGGKVVGTLVSGLGIAYSSNILFRLGLFIVTFVLTAMFMMFNLNKKPKKNDVKEEVEDLFEVEKPKKKTAVLPLAIILGLLVVLSLVAFIPWASAFGMKWATNFHTNFNNSKIFGVPLFQYIVGSSVEFGSWDLFGLQAVLLITSVVIALVSKLNFDDFVSSFVEGIKKSSKLLLVLLMIYFVLTMNYYFPALGTLFSSMMKEFNYFISAIIAFIASIFGVEMQYAWMFSGQNFATTFANQYSKETLAVIYQATYGLAQFVAPTSLFLMLGLAYLDIPYTEWFKKVWKLLVCLLVVAIVVVIIVTQI